MPLIDLCLEAMKDVNDEIYRRSRQGMDSIALCHNAKLLSLTCVALRNVHLHLTRWFR